MEEFFSFETVKEAFKTIGALMAGSVVTAGGIYAYWKKLQTKASTENAATAKNETEVIQHRIEGKKVEKLAADEDDRVGLYKEIAKELQQGIIVLQGQVSQIQRESSMAILESNQRQRSEMEELKELHTQETLELKEEIKELRAALVDFERRIYQERSDHISVILALDAAKEENKHLCNTINDKDVEVRSLKTEFFGLQQAMGKHSIYIRSVEKRKNLPAVELDESENTLSLRGESQPVNAYAELFYGMLQDILKSYFSRHNKLAIEFDIPYLNTISQKCMLNLMVLLNDYGKAGSTILALWLWHDEDEDTEEAGLALKKEVDFIFTVQKK